MTRSAPDSVSKGSSVYRPLDEAPAKAVLRATAPEAEWAGLDAHHFEYVSRGDFVGGTLYLPPNQREAAESDAPSPLILLTHATGSSAQGDELGFAAEWVRQGFAVATIDLPLHGHRQSPKLSERLIESLGSLQNDRALDADRFALVEEFCRQATSDLIRAVEALTGLPMIEATRVALMGLGAGALVSAYAAAHDPRPRACVLTFGCGQRAHPELDPAAMLSARDPAIPLLIFRFESDPETNPDSVDQLFERASEPKQRIELSGSPVGPTGLAKDAASQAFTFLRDALA